MKRKTDTFLALFGLVTVCILVSGSINVGSVSAYSAFITTNSSVSLDVIPSGDIDDTFNINYGLKVDDTISPGNYQMASQGAIVYYFTTNPSCTLYSVQYQANGADNPNGMGSTDVGTGDKSVSTVATTLTTSNANIDSNNSTLPITNIYNVDSSLATKFNSLSPIF